MLKRLTPSTQAYTAFSYITAMCIVTRVSATTITFLALIIFTKDDQVSVLVLKLEGSAILPVVGYAFPIATYRTTAVVSKEQK